MAIHQKTEPDYILYILILALAGLVYYTSIPQEAPTSEPVLSTAAIDSLTTVIETTAKERDAIQKKKVELTGEYIGLIEQRYAQNRRIKALLHNLDSLNSIDIAVEKKYKFIKKMHVKEITNTLNGI